METIVHSNRLTFIRRVEKNKHGHWKALYKCDCGNETIKLVANVNRCTAMSCGCLKRELLSINKPGLKHGLAGSKLYDVHHLMMRRCYEVGSKNYHQYGGRGINVCAEWHDVSAFCKWATSNGWQYGLQLDRENNNGNYEPDNCRFVTSMVNCNNRRDNYLITYNGKTQSLSEWSRETGIGRKTIYYRIEKFGWTIESTLNEKPKWNKRLVS